MVLQKQLTAATAAVLLAGGATVASAQSIIGTGGNGGNTYIGYVVSVDPFFSQTGSTYVYTYSLTNEALPFASSTVDTFTFNFGPTVPVSFASVTGDGGFGAPTSLTAGAFSFGGTGLAAGQTAKFTFDSTYAPVASNGVAISSTGVAPMAGGGTSALGPGIAPAPEPGSLVSMAVLTGCLGLGIAARRRKALSN